jgi:hypothetical protein
MHTHTHTIAKASFVSLLARLTPIPLTTPKPNSAAVHVAKIEDLHVEIILASPTYALAKRIVYKVRLKAHARVA